GMDDKIVEFEITNNRPDCLSMLGIARETAATLGKKLKYPKVSLPTDSKDVEKYVSIEVKNPDLCPRFAIRVIKNITIKSSPSWMQERLIKAGVRPINNIVDITNYVMLELGQPMHAYDLDKLKGKKIIVRNAAKEEMLTTLDEKNRNLNESVLVIADGERSIGIAGIMGGYDSEIEDYTKEIALECANFNPVSVRMSSKRLGLRTEASSRFEKGLDWELIPIAINRACYLIEQLGAGEVVDGIIDIYPKIKEKRIINFRTDRVKWLLGIDISVDMIKRMLRSLEFEVDGEEVLKITVPTFRDDIETEADVNEEIARLYGYDNIPSKLMDTTFTQGVISERQKIKNIAKDNLTAQGLYEVLTYSFVSPGVFDKINLAKGDHKRKAITLINPLGEEQSIMRTTIIPNMLELIGRNYNRKIEEGSFFEISKVYIAQSLPLTGLPDEKDTLTIGMYGNYDFYDLKGIIENLLSCLNIQHYKILPSKHDTLHPGKTAALWINNIEIGFFGEVHPFVLNNYDIPAKTYIAELDFEKIFAKVNLNRIFVPLPRFPSIERDIAIVIANEVSSGQIEDIIKNKGGKLIERIELFDVYKGSQIEEGYKSLAFRLVYRSNEKTLTEDDITKVHNRIINSLTNQVGAILRQ
ncbi:MAG: phenylalanine--tRNA ligase subunit beta, partial [Clostridiales bacterium]|nr:phenylalanine--tRNA ligase subunit beta [Clostridiales bacterium]